MLTLIAEPAVDAAAPPPAAETATGECTLGFTCLIMANERVEPAAPVEAPKVEESAKVEEPAKIEEPAKVEEPAAPAPVAA